MPVLPGLERQTPLAALQNITVCLLLQMHCGQFATPGCDCWIAFPKHWHGSPSNETKRCKAHPWPGLPHLHGPATTDLYMHLAQQPPDQDRHHGRTIIDTEAMSRLTRRPRTWTAKLLTESQGFDTMAPSLGQPTVCPRMPDMGFKITWHKTRPWAANIDTSSLDSPVMCAAHTSTHQDQQ